MAEAFNLARRLSARNEPDLLQEDFAGNDDDNMNNSNSNKFNQQYCFNLVKNVCPTSPLPQECKKYPDVFAELKRRNSDRHEHTIAFAGMSPGEKAAAMAARERGALSQAQIKRRLTSPKDKESSWW